MAAWKNKLYFFDYKNFQKCINIGKKDYSIQHTHSIYANILLLLLSNIVLQIGTCFSNGEGNGNPPVFLPGKFHGQRNLEGCSPWGCKESDTTEHSHFHFLKSVSCASTFFKMDNIKLNNILMCKQFLNLLCSLFGLFVILIKSEKVKVKVTQLCVTLCDPI